MDKKILIATAAGSVLLAIILLGIGTLIGRSLYEPKTVVLNTTGGSVNSSTKFAQTQNTITVVGHNNPTVSPNVALINLGIEICDPDAEKANQEVNAKLISLTTGLQAIGLDKESIVPSDFTEYPQSLGAADQQFCAINQVEVTTTKLNEVSNILNQALASGANNVYGVNFTSNDLELATQKGIQLAYQDAENQAQTLAKSMNESIQGIVSSNVDLSGNLLGVFVGYSGGGGAVSPQNNTLTISVTVVYAVEK